MALQQLRPPLPQLLLRRQRFVSDWPSIRRGLFMGLWAAGAAISVGLAIRWVTSEETVRMGADWRVLVTAGERIVAGMDPYRFAVGEQFPASFRWSPLTAYFFILVAPLGPGIWTVLNVTVLAIADRRVAFFAVTSPPFWMDVSSGLSFTFVLTFGVLAVRGSMLGGLGWIALSVLIPRPLMVPVLIWLLWTQPRLRLPGLIILAAGAAGALVTGWGDEWVRTLLALSETGDTGPWTIVPRTILGALWVPAVALAALWLGSRRLFGLASLVMNPYWLPGYYQIALLDLTSRTPRSR